VLQARRAAGEVDFDRGGCVTSGPRQVSGPLGGPAADLEHRFSAGLSDARASYSLDALPILAAEDSLLP